MSSMLTTGVSGLKAFQSALNTTSHNISNSSTPGYSRQSVTLTSNAPQYSGAAWVGNGVTISTISRSYNDLIAGQVRSSSSSKNQWEMYSSFSDQINNLFGDSTTGLSVSLQDFFDAYQSVANSPTSSSERQVLISEAQSLVSQLQAYGTRLDELDNQITSQLQSEADTISGLADSIAQLNSQITAAVGNGGDPPNDMLDQRDALVDELATHVSVSTLKEGDGSMSVFIGNGQPLVIGSTASQLVTVTDPYDVSRKGLAIQTSSGTVDITQSLSGGTVGGLLQFRSEVLDPAKNSLGLVTVSVTSMVNDQQNKGMDLYGDLGADMFSLGGVEVLENQNNGGSASLSVTRANVTELTDKNYILTNTSGGWMLKDQATGAAVAMTGTGASNDPFVVDGLEIVVSGSASTGDSFLIRPTSAAVGSLSVTMTDPSGVAAAAPIIASASSSNTGTASITKGTVVDASDADLRAGATIRFTSATAYEILDENGSSVATGSYTSGQPITYNGWEVTISGSPANGDTFAIADNTSGTGDNRNALLLANLQDTDYLSGGTASINDVVGAWVADIGVKTNKAQSNYDIQNTLYDDNIAAQQSVSGVNLDEEAANLVRYQQAYSAAAQVIAAANALFDTLLAAVRD